MPVGPGGGGGADPSHPRAGVPLRHQRGRAEPAVRHRRGDGVPARLRDGRGAGGVPGAGATRSAGCCSARRSRTPSRPPPPGCSPPRQRSCRVCRRGRPGRAAAVHGGPGAGLPHAAAVPDRLAALAPVAVGGLADRAGWLLFTIGQTFGPARLPDLPTANPAVGRRPLRRPGADAPCRRAGAGHRGRRAGLHLADRAVPPVRRRGAQADRWLAYAAAWSRQHRRQRLLGTAGPQTESLNDYTNGIRLARPRVHPGRDRHRDPPLPPVRHRRRHQQDDRLRVAGRVHHRRLRRDRGRRRRPLAQRRASGRAWPCRSPPPRWWPWRSSRSGSGSSGWPTGWCTGSGPPPTRSCPRSRAGCGRTTPPTTCCRGWPGSWPKAPGPPGRRSG